MHLRRHASSSPQFLKGEIACMHHCHRHHQDSVNHCLIQYYILIGFRRNVKIFAALCKKKSYMVGNWDMHIESNYKKATSHMDARQIYMDTRQI